MDKNFDDFDLFMQEAGQPEKESASLEDFRRRFGMSRDAGAERLARRPTGWDVPEAPDITALLAQRCGTGYVTETGLFVAPGRDLPTSTAPQFPVADPLMLALGVEYEHDTMSEVPTPGSPLFKFEDARDLGREPLPLGPGLLRRSTAEILELVAQHVPPSARELAKRLAARARELEVT